eukprot:1706103-Karenia_brevis.AAC.1
MLAKSKAAHPNNRVWVQSLMKSHCEILKCLPPTMGNEYVSFTTIQCPLRRPSNMACIQQQCQPNIKTLRPWHHI